MSDVLSKIRQIAHELVDAESNLGWSAQEQSKAENARQRALECMRLLGKR